MVLFLVSISNVGNRGIGGKEVPVPLPMLTIYHINVEATLGCVVNGGSS